MGKADTEFKTVVTLDEGAGWVGRGILGTSIVLHRIVDFVDWVIAVWLLIVFFFSA